MRMTLVPWPSMRAPQARRKRARSTTSGSRAAFSRMVSPSASAAAMSRFSVPPTVGKSKWMCAPLSLRQRPGPDVGPGRRGRLPLQPHVQTQAIMPRRQPVPGSGWTMRWKRDRQLSQGCRADRFIYMPARWSETSTESRGRRPGAAPTTSGNARRHQLWLGVDFPNPACCVNSSAVGHFNQHRGGVPIWERPSFL